MDCGDAGHILLSRHIAEDLTQYRHWQPYLHDLGEWEVKHGQRLHLVNLYKNNLGNPHVPDKLKRRRTWKRKYTRAQYTRFSNRDCFPPASSSFRSASVRWKRVSKCLHELTVCDAFGIASPVHFKNRQHQLLEKWNHWRGCGLDYKFCVSASQKPI